ncbi:MAG TPA: ribonuclease HI [bacterium]|nr:ribonuclease HI [bacterium]
MTTSQSPHITIYTDGACKGNPGRGAWAAVLLAEDGKSKEISGTEDATTNNRMELAAVAEALKALKRPCRVTLHSDSAYIVNAFHQKWLDNWQRNGWRTADKSPVKNRDLWETIIDLCQTHTVRFEKVKGHAGIHYNERVDTLCNEALSVQ